MSGPWRRRQRVFFSWVYGLVLTYLTLLSYQNAFSNLTSTASDDRVVEDVPAMAYKPLVVPATRPTRNDYTSLIRRSTNNSKNTFRLADGWWTSFGNATARVWKDARNHNDWCIPESRPLSNMPITSDVLPVEGLLYVKSHKASSSTCEGINIQMARQVARRRQGYAPSGGTRCRHFNRHEFASAKQHGQRNVNASLLWTFVRNPRARDVSQVFHFRVSRQGVSVNDTERLLEALQRQRGTQTSYLWPTTLRPSQEAVLVQPLRDPTKTARMMEKLLSEYDFIGLTERMSESLAVMTLLWNLTVADVMVLSAKQSSSDGNNYDAGGKRRKCTRLQPPQLAPPLLDYLSSPAYIDNQVDHLLYNAVEMSLEATIAKLTVALVQERAQQIEDLQALINTQCRPHAIFPCSPNGTYQMERSAANCFIQDAGCGYPCVDRVVEGLLN